MDFDLPMPGVSLSASREVVAVFATLIALLATLLAGAATSAVGLLATFLAEGEQPSSLLHPGEEWEVVVARGGAMAGYSLLLLLILLPAAATLAVFDG